MGRVLRFNNTSLQQGLVSYYKLDGDINDSVRNTIITPISYYKLDGNTKDSVRSSGISPVSYYKFNGNSIDIIGANNGTDTNVSYVSGKNGQAASFGGSSSIKIGTSSSFSFIQNTGNFAISFWFKPNQIGVYEVILANTQTSIEKGFFIIKNADNSIFVSVVNGNGTPFGLINFTLPGAFTSTNWTHIAISSNKLSNLVSCYINGSLLGTSTVGTLSTGDSTREVTIGFLAGLEPYSFNGLIEDLNFFNETLEANQISETYNNSNVEFVSGQLGQAASFDGSTNKILDDSLVSVVSGKTTGTISAWVNIDSRPGNESILFSFTDNSLNTCLFVEFNQNSGAFQFVIFKDGALLLNQIVNTTTYPIYDRWTFITITQDGINSKIYFDGVLVSTNVNSYWFNTVTTSATSKIDNFSIGAIKVSPGYNSYLKGKVDEFKIFDTALTQYGVLELYSGSTVSWINGKIKQGASFNGVDSKIEVSTNSTSPFRQSSAITYSYWVKIPPGGFGAMGTASQSGQGSGGIYVYNGGMLFTWTPTTIQADSEYNSSFPNTPNTWVHVVQCISFTGSSSAQFYVNGLPVTTTLINGTVIDGTPSTSYNTNNGDSIGARYVNGYSGLYYSGFGNASFDEVGIWNRILSQNEVTQLYNGGLGNQYPFPRLLQKTNTSLQSELASYYKLDGNSIDSVGINNGTDNAITYGNGKINKAASFENGSGTLISLASTIVLPYNSTYSISFWLNPKNNNVTTVQGILTNNTTSFGIFQSKDDGVFGVKYNGDAYQASFTNEGWNHVVFVASGGTGNFYINGILSITITIPSYASGVFELNTIGLNNGSYFFNGELDELGIWNRVLSSTEISQLYNGGAGTQYPFPKIAKFENNSLVENLVAGWNFDGDLKDVLGNRDMVLGTPSTNLFSNISKIGKSFLTNGNIFQTTFLPTDPLTSWTYSIWIRPIYYEPVAAFIFNNVPITDALYIDYTSNQIYWYSPTATINYPITYDTWYHFALVKNGTNMNMYVNGVLTSTSQNGSESPMIFQQFGYNGFSTFLSGQFDSLNIFSKALNLNEVAQLYNNGNGCQYPFNNDLDSSTIEWLYYLDSTPSYRFIVFVDNLIKRLKTNLIWDQLDRLWIFNTETQQQSTISLKSPSSTPGVANTINWTTSGYTGLGGYFNTNFNPLTQGVNYTLNSACGFAYSIQDVASNLGSLFGSFDGVNVSTWLYPKYKYNGIDLAIYYANNDTSNEFSYSAETNTLGLYSVVRNTALNSSLYKNGLIIGDSVHASSAIPNLTLYVLNGHHTSLSWPYFGTVSFAGFGSGNIDQTKLYEALQEFAISTGINV